MGQILNRQQLLQMLKPELQRRSNTASWSATHEAAFWRSDAAKNRAG